MAVKNERGKGKQRDSGTRQRKSIVLFATEGNNKTETLYFKNFNQKNIQIKFTRGNETDPEKMMKRLLDEAEDMGLVHPWNYLWQAQQHVLLPADQPIPP